MTLSTQGLYMYMLLMPIKSEKRKCRNWVIRLPTLMSKYSNEKFALDFVNEN